MKPIIRNEHPAGFSAVEHIAFWNQYVPGSSAEEACGDEAAPAAFDAGFPAKQKAWQPSQEVLFIQSHSLIGW